MVEPSILEDVEVEKEATLRRVRIRILGTEIKKLRNREVKLVKVQWSEAQEDATWETEEKIRALYPFLFEGPFSISFPINLKTFRIMLLLPMFSWLSSRSYLENLR